jgi:uncharacterized damage-inducible protein DinB
MSTPGFLHDLLTREQSRFGKVVGAVLEDWLDFRPEPRARSARELIGHLLGHNFDLIELLDDGVIHHRMQMPVESVAAAVRELDDSFGEGLDRLASFGSDRWMEPAEFRVGEQVLFTAPRQMLAWMLFLDAIHHRGQLSTYLRPMGSRVPSIYGPSADDPGALSALNRTASRLLSGERAEGRLMRKRSRVCIVLPFVLLACDDRLPADPK